MVSKAKAAKDNKGSTGWMCYWNLTLSNPSGVFHFQIHESRGL